MKLLQKVYEVFPRIVWVIGCSWQLYKLGRKLKEVT